MAEQNSTLNGNFKKQEYLIQWPNTQYGRAYVGAIPDKDNKDNILYKIYLKVTGVEGSDTTLRVFLYFQSDLDCCHNNNYDMAAYKDFNFCSRREREEAFKIANALSDKLKPFLENKFIDKLFTEDNARDFANKLGFNIIRLD